jgi:ribosome biogenesis GTPase
VLEGIGYDAAMDRWVTAGDAVLGRVVRVDRGLAQVLTEEGLLRVGYAGAVLAETARHPEAAPCTGDWVVVRDWPDGRHTLEQVLPRRSAVVRATAGEQSHGHVLCANADVVGVVVALHPEPVLARVERLLALAWQSGARPLVLLTKADLVPDADYVAEDVRAVGPGVDVRCLSSTTGAGVAEVRDLLKGRLTLALLGASGHGKSSLANALVGAQVLATRAIREDGRGRHTTVRRELMPLPGGGAVIDTPGLRGIGLVDGAAGVTETFADVEALVASCRFRDCGHVSEPGCAVREALETGALPLRRFESWQALHAETSAHGRRRAARLRRNAPDRRRPAR